MFENLNRIRPLFTRRDKVIYLGMLLLMGGSALFEVIGVGAVPAFIATLAVPEKVLAFPVVGPFLERVGIDTGEELVIWGCIGLIVVFAVRSVYLVGVFNILVRVTEYHRVRLADRLFRAYIAAPYEFYLQRNSAELLRNVQTETAEIINGVVNPLMKLILNGLTTIGIVVLIVVASPPEVLGGIFIVIGGSWLVLRFTRDRMKQFGQIAKNERMEGIRAVNQGLGGFLDARVLGREKWFTDTFRRSAAELARVNRMRGVVGQASPYIIEMCALVGLLVIVLALFASGIGFGQIVTILALFGMAVVRLRGAVGAIVAKVNQMQFSGAALPVVLDDLKLLEKSQRSTRKGAREPVRLRDKITTRNLTYTYPNVAEPALKNVNVTIEKGTSVGFVGSTGSGKTTLISVLLGLLKPQEGQVLVDGIDMQENLRGWLDNVGYIPQTIYLLDETIRRNIAFGIDDADIDEEKVMRALMAAQLAEFVESLPDGLGTIVGERGVRLSGGQRQRIGLARALYHEPEVIIMDEATSALDNRTENLVMEALDNLKEGRTFIMIAHRLSTIRDCDRLYFLRHGVVEAEGTYDELVMAHPEFREMAEVA